MWQNPAWTLMWFLNLIDISTGELYVNIISSAVLLILGHFSQGFELLSYAWQNPKIYGLK